MAANTIVSFVFWNTYIHTRGKKSCRTISHLEIMTALSTGYDTIMPTNSIGHK